MNISDNYKKIIADEFRSVVGRMKEIEDLSKKLYWLSAAYGVVSRVFNIEFDALLLCLFTWFSMGHIILLVQEQLLLERVETKLSISQRVCLTAFRKWLRN